MDIVRLIRDVQDFPKPGIVFKDLTPLLADAAALVHVTDQMVLPFRDQGIEQICAIEARGFIFGAAAARALGCGFVPLRKPGKLPAKHIGVDYALEYGSDRLEMHADAVANGARVLIVDDVLATGGTLAAAADLVGKGGGVIVGAALAIEIAALNGRARWQHAGPLHSVIVFS
jgi:adenine phosphoribosyltransferase